MVLGLEAEKREEKKFYPKEEERKGQN